MMKNLHKFLAVTTAAAVTAAAVLPVCAGAQQSDQFIQPEQSDQVVLAEQSMQSDQLLQAALSTHSGDEGTDFTETDYDAMTALGEEVSVRSGPGMEFEEIDILPEGEIVHVSQEQFNEEENATWCFITCDSVEGWVLLSVLDVDYPEEGYYFFEDAPEEVYYEAVYSETTAEPLYEAMPAADGGEARNVMYDMAVEVEEVYDGLAMEEEYWDPVEMYPYIPFEPSLDGEKYAEYDETGFQLVQAAPLSTFSADVDTASYANIRRMIMDGYGVTWIPEDAVRAEEFVNYFSYDLDEPDDDETFSVSIEASTCPWNEDHELMMIGIRAKDIDAESIRQNLVFLVDISGSMWDSDKLPLAKKSMIKLLDTLSPEDTISIVTYASGEDLVLSGVHPTERMLGHIKAKINQLEAEGSTAGEKGLQMAYEVAQDNYIEGGNNRIILMTDGDLNVGISDPDDLEQFITEKAKSGVYLSALGFGEGNLRDDAIERLADCGNGNYSYIDSTLEAKKVLIDEAPSTLFTVANDVKFQIEFNPEAINAYRLIGYENRRLADTDFKDDTKDAGEIGAGYEMVALYELIPADSDAAISLRYQQDSKDNIIDEFKDDILDEANDTVIDETKDTFTKVDEKEEKGDKENNVDDFSDELGMLSIRWKEPGQEKAEEMNVIIHKDVYTDDPSDAFRFAAAVTEFAQSIRGSENNGNGSLEDVYDILDEIDLDDEYKEEFKYLVRTLIGRED